MSRDTLLRHRAEGLDRLLGWLILLAALLLPAGWCLPVMTVHRLVFLSEEVSILRGMLELWQSGHYGLFLLLLLFSVAFPLAKLAAAFLLWHAGDPGDPRGQRLLFWLDHLGKWSMLDVFVVALVVVAIQVSLVAEVETHAGIYVFAAAVLLSMFAVRRLLALARRVNAGA